MASRVMASRIMRLTRPKHPSDGISSRRCVFKLLLFRDTDLVDLRRLVRAPRLGPRPRLGQGAPRWARVVRDHGPARR
ncbi:MAG: hypothetical protein M9894_20410 [Planctomycetes bacterium]|nr:hypothetical protein [Planctomycetota bacterium]